MFDAIQTCSSQKNPHFPHEAYAKFDLDEMAESESLAEFRFRKRDILSLAEVLEIPETMRCDQRSICGGISLQIRRHDSAIPKTSPCRSLMQ